MPIAGAAARWGVRTAPDLPVCPTVVRISVTPGLLRGSRGLRSGWHFTGAALHRRTSPADLPACLRVVRIGVTDGS